MTNGISPIPQFKQDGQKHKRIAQVSYHSSSHSNAQVKTKNSVNVQGELNSTKADIYFKAISMK